MPSTNNNNSTTSNNNSPAVHSAGSSAASTTMMASSSSASRQEALRRMMKIVASFLARPDIAPFREPVDWRGLELYDYPEIIKHQMDLGTIQRKLERHQYESAGAVAHDIRLVWKNCMTYNAVGSEFWLLAKGYSKRFEDRYRRIRNEYDVGEEPVDSDEEEEEEEETSADEDEEEELEDEDEDDNNDEEEEFEGDTAAPNNNNKQPTTKSRVSTPPPPKLDARAKFASNLLLLTGVQLGHVIGMLEKQCPAALEQQDSNCQHQQQLLPEKMEINLDKIEPPHVFHSIAHYATDKASKTKRRGMSSSIAAASPKIVDVSNKRRRK